MDGDNIADQLNSITRQISRLNVDIEELGNHNERLTEEMSAARAALTQLEVVLLGNPSYRIVGAAERLDLLEKLVGDIVKDRRTERDKLRGIQIGLALTVLGSGGTLVTVLSQVFG